MKNEILRLTSLRQYNRIFSKINLRFNLIDSFLSALINIADPSPNASPLQIVNKIIDEYYFKSDEEASIVTNNIILFINDVNHFLSEYEEMKSVSAKDKMAEKLFLNFQQIYNDESQLTKIILNGSRYLIVEIFRFHNLSTDGSENNFIKKLEEKIGKDTFLFLNKFIFFYDQVAKTENLPFIKIKELFQYFIALAAMLNRDRKEKFIKQTGKEKVIFETKLAGRNDPCPCGSGKKYKKCCFFK